MTLESSLSKAVFNGNGTATEFAFTFKVWDDDQIAVTVSDPDGYAEDVTADATIVLDADSGGTVTYLLDGDPLPSGYKLAITRNMPFLQRVDLVSATRFDPQVMEDALDTATAERQELKEQLARAVILPPTSDTTPEQVVESIYQSRDAAAESASAASDSAEAASSSALLAQAWAESDTAPDPEDEDSKSAKSWAGEAATSATAASGSASDASDSATQAQAWAESDTAPDPNDPTSKSAKKWAEVASDNVPIATTNLAGKVKPDGTTIGVTSDGTISAQTATASAKGIVKPDGETTSVNADGAITANIPSASSSTPAARSASGAVGTSTAYARADHSHPNNWGSTTVAAISPAVVIETWHSGADWYRVWSDGWIEQGGTIETNKTSVTYNKPFVNTPLSLVIGYKRTTADSWYGATTTNTTMTVASFSTYERWYYVCGY